MCRWARLLHVLVIAPAAVLLTVAAAPTTVVQAAGPQVPPRYVICIDPGHGGADPGAIGIEGQFEKELTLDVSLRLRRLLEADMVKVVMTREDDRDVSIPARSQIANDAGAALFVSVHLNGYADPTIGGLMTLYPGAKDQPFARVMDEQLAARLARYSIGNGGSQLRDDWWVHVAAPAVTVESAYITNQREGALLSTPSFREVIATAIRDGIETFKPDITKRKQQILAAEHPGGSAPRPGPNATAGGVSAHADDGPLPGRLLPGVLLVLAAALAVRHRRSLWWLLGVATRATGRGFRHTAIHRRAQRRRRRLLRERTLAGRAASLIGHRSVYDELFL